MPVQPFVLSAIMAAVKVAINVTALADYFFDDFDGTNVSLTGRTGWTAAGDATKAAKLRADGGFLRMTTSFNGEAPYGYQVAAADLTTGGKIEEFDYDFTQDAATDGDAANPWQRAAQVWYLAWTDESNNINVQFDFFNSLVRMSLYKVVSGTQTLLVRYINLPMAAQLRITLTDRIRVEVNGKIKHPDQLFSDTDSVYPDRKLTGLTTTGGFAVRHLFYNAAYSRYLRVNPVLITINDPQKFWGRDESLGRDIPLSGTYTGTPSSWVYRIIDAKTGTIGSWQTLSTTASAGTWSATVRVGTGLSQIDVGWIGADGFARIARSTSFGVGPLIFYYGQSNAAGAVNRGLAWSNGTQDSTFAYNGSTVGSGTTYQRWWQDSESDSNSFMINAVSLASTLSAALGIPVGVAGTGVTATELALLKPGTTNWTTKFLPMLTLVGGNVEHFVWCQGEAEALASSSYANYASDFAELVTGFRSVGGRPNAGVFIRLIGEDNNVTVSAATTSRASGFRQLQLTLENPSNKIWMASNPLGVTLQDNIHFSHAGQVELTRREGISIANRIYSASAYDGRGPIVTGGTRSGATITLTVNLNGATSISGSSLTGYVVSADDFATTLAISSINVVSNVIVIVLAAVPVGAVKVASYREANYDVTSIATGAYADGTSIPVFPIVNPITVT